MSGRRERRVLRLLSSSWVSYSPWKLDCAGALADATGYYNPLIAYGEEKAVRDAREAGANGYIMVDLPPSEAMKFRQICTSEG